MSFIKIEKETLLSKAKETLGADIASDCIVRNYSSVMLEYKTRLSATNNLKNFLSTEDLDDIEFEVNEDGLKKPARVVFQIEKYLMSIVEEVVPISENEEILAVSDKGDSYVVKVDTKRAK